MEPSKTVPMTIEELSRIDKDGVVVEALGDTSNFRVRFSGNADARVRDAIEAFLLQTHEVARSQKVSKVVVDFRELDFMNSACFKAFVVWLARVRALTESEQYLIHFLSNDDIHWQRRSLRALSCFAANVVRVGQ